MSAAVGDVVPFRRPALIVGPREKAPSALEVRLLRTARRGTRALFINPQDLMLWTPAGWILIPAGYVTDFGSIPFGASVLTFGRLQPLGAGLLGFLGHDYPYAVGEPGRRDRADDALKYRLELDGVDRFDRGLILAAVQTFGGVGYKRAKGWWDTENFADLATNAYPLKAPFPREDAFDGARFGLRANPDWDLAA